MEVRIKLVNSSMPVPKYHSIGAVSFDLYSREHIIVPSKGVVRVPLNVIIEIPRHYCLLLKERSSLLKKKLILTAGVIDQDYCGPGDEIQAQVYNLDDTFDAEIEPGERIVQGLFLQIGKVSHWKVVEEDLRKEPRGGFGTTGTYVPFN